MGVQSGSDTSSRHGYEYIGPSVLTEQVTEVKPDIKLVEVHPQLRRKGGIQWMDGWMVCWWVLVGAGSLLTVLWILCQSATGIPPPVRPSHDSVRL